MSSTTFQTGFLLRALNGDTFSYCGIGSESFRSGSSSSNLPTVTYPTSSFTFTKNISIDTITPIITGSITSCTASPALVAGLTISATDCSISGRPLASQITTSHTISFSGATGSSSTSINIEVRLQASKFIIVANSGSNNLNVFSINANGSLTSVPGSPFVAGGAGARFVVVNPLGTYAYVANGGSASVSVFSINSTTGFLTPIAGSPFATAPVSPANPSSLAMDPNGKFLYISPTPGNTLYVHSINQTTGALTYVNTYTTVNTANLSFITIDVTGRFLYNTITNATNNIDGFRIDATTGALTQISGLPLTAGNNMGIGAVDPFTRFYYSISYSSNTLSGYLVNSTTGALSPIAGSPFSDPAFGTSSTMAIDPTGKFVYVANNTTPTISGFSINQSTGAVTSIGSAVATGAAPGGIAVDPTGKFLYVTNGGPATVSGYSINATTGVLTAVPGSPFSTVTTNPNAFSFVSY
ncbi:MAG TPA: beta-propeller fold lactonase family protein [Leptospiraceae bacterium]|nr:beta-propeller fold lactonase family protein [Leptospiraceae bacterium]HMZ67498.1 beta-propeller fold lactonase family protein [Leptospiraceae bacterium]HNA10462.1 beta-propeller fold lactonase family protein [Leptospiraceae bacterium]HNC59521.1 beta-propeller fold lactonase family protein [Leptospiraceae bacterium]HNF57586.1 beta-propeller fold lactonase family protein [Leptospiraceae bacterium]